MPAIAPTSSTHQFGSHNVKIYFNEEADVVVENNNNWSSFAKTYKFPLQSWARTFNAIGTDVMRYASQPELCELVKNGNDEYSQVMEIKGLIATDPTTKKTARIFVTCLGERLGGSSNEVVISTFDPRAPMESVLE